MHFIIIIIIRGFKGFFQSYFGTHLLSVQNAVIKIVQTALIFPMEEQSKCSVSKLVKPTNELKYIFLDYMFSFGNIASDFHV